MSNKKRECGNCNVCCEGVVSGVAYGKSFGNGNPCPFLKNKKCSIYENKPHICNHFKCAWLENKHFPNRFKPNEIGVLVYVVEFPMFMGKKISYYAINKKMNNVDKIKQMIYVEEIIEWMESNKYNWMVLENFSIIRFGGSESFISKLK